MLTRSTPPSSSTPRLRIPSRWQQHGESPRRAARAQGRALDLRLPAVDFQADGERTGKYQLNGEELKTNAKGESIISYVDYAIAIG